MGCRLAKDQQSTLTLPCFNMLVLGQSQVGKTKLLSLLKGEQTQQHNTLEINSITLNKTLKLLTFQVSGRAEKTWKNYYKCCDIVMVVLDVNSKENLQQMRQKLVEIDSGISQKGMIFVVLNKVDLLMGVISPQTHLSEWIQGFVSQLKLSQLRHDVAYCLCSTENEQHIKTLSKKLFEFVFLRKLKSHSNDSNKK